MANHRNTSRDNLIGWIVANLPDSITERRRVLTNALDCLPARHPMRERLSTMITFLESHQRQQLEFTRLLDLPTK